MATFNKQAFVVLEGGGAKGIAHVGALKAIEQAGYHVVGIAGTSAGALVAAIYAFGFKADQIIDIRNGHTILQSLNPPRQRPTDLLGGGWWAINIIQRVTTGRMRFVTGVIIFLLLVGIVTALLMWEPPHPLLAALGLVVLGIVSIAALFARVVNGLITLDKCTSAIQGLLAQQANLPSDESVTFRSVGPNHNRPILKIVATDINCATMRVFSSDETPDVSVAEAVAASVCIPVVFRSRKISTGLPQHAGHHFLDGGLVSNLPAWVFDAERSIHRDATTIVIEIDPESTSPRLKSSLQWLNRAVQSAVFGASDLSIRGVDRILRVPLTAKPLSVLDFDIGFRSVKKIVLQAQLTTEAVLAAENQRRDTVKSLRILTTRVLAEPNTAGEPRHDVGNIRISMAILKNWEVDRLRQDNDHYISAQFIYRAGFNNYHDRLQAFPLANTPEAMAILEGQAVYWDMTSDDTLVADDPRDPRTAAVNAYRAQAEWILALPMVSIKQTGGDDNASNGSGYFVVVDGSKALAFKGDQLDKKLRVVYQIIQLTVQKLAQIHYDDTQD